MKILMVCLGNICRSPLAEGIMAQKAREAGLNWHVDSAGTGAWHAGQPPDFRSIRVAKKYGVDISQQLARQFQLLDFQRFDHIFVMDKSNRTNVARLTQRSDDRAKVSLLLDLAEPGSEREVPDPFYDDDQFEPVFKLIETACAAFVKRHSSR